MESNETQDILVHTDRRACVTAPILHNFAKECGLDRLPKKVYAARTDKGFVLRWKDFEGSKNYDLSIRDRVLIAGFVPGQRLVASVSGDALFVEGSARAIAKTKGSRTAVSPKPKKPRTKPVTKAKPSAPPTKGPKKMKTERTSTKSRDGLAMNLKPGICADVVENYQTMPLLEAAQVLAQYIPDITVGDLVNAKGSKTSSLHLFEFMSEQLGVTAPKASTPKTIAPKTNGHAKSAASSKIVADADLLQSIRTAGKDGASIHDLMKVTHKPLPITREAVRHLIKMGKVKRKGNTRASRYFATA
jgi:hypothetical protein